MGTPPVCEVGFDTTNNPLRMKAKLLVAKHHLMEGYEWVVSLSSLEVYCNDVLIVFASLDVGGYRQLVHEHVDTNRILG